MPTVHVYGLHTVLNNIPQQNYLKWHYNVFCEVQIKFLAIISSDFKFQMTGQLSEIVNHSKSYCY